MNDEMIFRRPLWYKRFGPVLAVVCFGHAVWLISGFSAMLHDCDGWRVWLFAALGVFTIFILIVASWDFAFEPYETLGVLAEGIVKKNIFSVTHLPWDSILGVHILFKGEAFCLIGVSAKLVFNPNNFVNGEDLSACIREKLAFRINQDAPSKSEEVLGSLIELVLDRFPDASPWKVYDRIYQVDAKLKYNHVKDLTESIKEKMAASGARCE